MSSAGDCRRKCRCFSRALGPTSNGRRSASRAKPGSQPPESELLAVFDDEIERAVGVEENFRLLERIEGPVALVSCGVNESPRPHHSFRRFQLAFQDVN